MMRPRWRMPIWMAFAVLAAAWVARSLFRGGDFGLDMPQDLIALGAVTIGAGAVWWLRRSDASENPDHNAAHDYEHNKDSGSDEQRDAHEV